MRRAARLLAIASLASACSKPQGVGYDVIDVEVTHADGGAVAVFPDQTCTTLPVLLGSRVIHRYPVDAALSVVVDVDRDGATITFPGAVGAATLERWIASEELHAGSLPPIDVTSTTGSSYVVYLATSCPLTKP